MSVQKKTTARSAIVASLLAVGSVASALGSEQAKTWPASEKAKRFVEETIVIDFFASPYGMGWTEPEQLHAYMKRARGAGITGASATLAATYYTWEQFLAEHHQWRSTMLETPDKYTFVKHVEDIERAHKQGRTAVIWNSQTTSILNGDLRKIATLREMGLGSMQIVYNGRFRSGVGRRGRFDRDRHGAHRVGSADHR